MALSFPVCLCQYETDVLSIEKIGNIGEYGISYDSEILSLPLRMSTTITSFTTIAKSVILECNTRKILLITMQSSTIMVTLHHDSSS